MALRAMREASLSRSPGYLNKEMPDDSGAGSWYVLSTVQAGMPMTVKEMGSASARRLAFLILALPARLTLLDGGDFVARGEASPLANKNPP